MTSRGRAIVLALRLVLPALIVSGAVMRCHLSAEDQGRDFGHVLGLTSDGTRYLDRQIEVSTAFEAWLVLGAYASSYVVFHCIRLGSLIVFAVFWRAIWQGDYRIDTRPRGIEGR
jgi:hypothetical protein